ncbi:MAG: DUF1493 family protein [Candidatus Thiodiazotropha sp. (ex Ctena orbiculata)]|nr:DUF1493 family protein [Candidatus Thiodiazotropha taylori]
MQMKDVTFEHVKDFAIRELWQIKGEISPNTRLAHDFGIAGLDGLEFIEAFSKEFNVKIDGFDWVYYFGPEESVSLISLANYLYEKVQGNEEVSCDLSPITLGHLVNYAKKGEWFEPSTVQNA